MLRSRIKRLLISSGGKPRLAMSLFYHCFTRVFRKLCTVSVRGYNGFVLKLSYEKNHLFINFLFNPITDDWRHF